MCQIKRAIRMEFDVAFLHLFKFVRCLDDHLTLQCNQTYVFLMNYLFLLKTRAEKRKECFTELEEGLWSVKKHYLLTSEESRSAYNSYGLLISSTRIITIIPNPPSKTLSIVHKLVTTTGGILCVVHFFFSDRNFY